MSHSADKLLLYTTLLLLALGFLVLTSASLVISYKNFGSPFYYTLRQLLQGGIGGGAVLLLTQWIPYRWWKTLAVPLVILSFLLLALVFVPEVSYGAGGARRWLKIGTVSFQPSELLKLSFIMYLAGWLDARRREIASFSYGMIPFALMLAIIGIFLVMQPDIGTLGVIVASAAVLYFLGGGTKFQIAALGAFGASMFYLLVQLAPYRLHRILVFLNPRLDPQGIGYQANQAAIAIGSGGFWGQGFGRSLQKYSYLPEPLGDSIFAIFAEEVGFLGVAALIALFLFFFSRGISIAQSAPDTFGKLLAAGISISILLQAFINMAAISGLLPLTGIALPFVSYGSTSLIMTLAGVGILLNISKQA